MHSARNRSGRFGPSWTTQASVARHLKRLQLDLSFAAAVAGVQGVAGAVFGLFDPGAMALRSPLKVSTLRWADGSLGITNSRRPLLLDRETSPLRARPVLTLVLLLTLLVVKTGVRV